jgi:hypothetical protein
MNAKYGNGAGNKTTTVDNLDYTIELDGQQYNITAADSLYADVARRTQAFLNIAVKSLGESSDPSKETTYDINKDDISYNGSKTQSISIVPSTGGVFSGPIVVPGLDDKENKDYAINLGDVEDLIAELRGFPTYLWTDPDDTDDTRNGTLEPIETAVPTMSPFKVVIYRTSYNNPKDLQFKNIAGKAMDCYFLAINTETKWLSIGRCRADDKDGPQETLYFNLRVKWANEALYLVDAKDANKSYKYQDIKDFYNQFINLCYGQMKNNKYWPGLKYYLFGWHDTWEWDEQTTPGHKMSQEAYRWELDLEAEGNKVLDANENVIKVLDANGNVIYKLDKENNNRRIVDETWCPGLLDYVIGIPEPEEIEVTDKNGKRKLVTCYYDYPGLIHIVRDGWYDTEGTWHAPLKNRVTALETKLDTSNPNSFASTVNNHISNSTIHRQIFYGTAPVGTYFSTGDGKGISTTIGDIYIKIEQ